MSIVSKKDGSQGYKSCPIFDIMASVKYNALVAFIFYLFFMKKILFVLAIFVLGGGAWYMSQNSNVGNGGESNFEKAMKLMQNLQSSAIPVVLTENELDTLERGYQDALVRKPQITNNHYSYEKK